jgi:hypothetical protein
VTQLCRPGARRGPGGRGGQDGDPANYNAEIRESASVAHIYGQNIVAAEPLTAGGGKRVGYVVP